MTYKLDQIDIAQLLNVSEDTVRRQLKAAGVKRGDFPGLMRWIFPRLMLGFEQGIDYRKRWREVLQRQAEEKKQPSAKQLEVLAMGRARKFAGSVQAQPTVLPPFEDRPQDFPDYDR